MKLKKGIIGFLALTLVVVLSACSSSGSGKTVVVGSKNFTENIILAHMLAELIEAKTDLKVERKVNLGGSDVAWTAFKSNEIQLYPDYTGTVVANYYQEETGTADETLAKTIELLEADGYKFIGPYGLNNTYTLAVKQETAEKYNLKTFSDLAEVSDQLVLGSEFEFLDRPDGLPGLVSTYNMNFKDAKGMDHGIMYRSLNEGEVDVIDAFATDGQIVQYNLVVLEDDKEFFPPYHAGTLVRKDLLEKYPELEEVLSVLNDAIDDDTMQALNNKVDAEGLREDEVAREFLKENNLI